MQPAPLFGGAERQAATNIPLLRNHGVDVVPLVGPGRAIADWLHERGVHAFVHTPNFPGGWAKPHGITRATLPFRYVQCGLRLREEVFRLVKEHAIDLIYAALPFSWVVATPIARTFGIPIVWRAGGIEVSSLEKRSLRAFTRLHRPDRMVCPAEKIQTVFEPLVRAPFDVIVNGVDAAQFHPAAGDPSRHRPPGARMVVGFAARLVPQKRIEDFLAAAGRLSRERPDVSFSRSSWRARGASVRTTRSWRARPAATSVSSATWGT
jgi:glycosyltransferase involved in cell wall biosynthesis